MPQTVTDDEVREHLKESQEAEKWVDALTSKKPKLKEEEPEGQVQIQAANGYRSYFGTSYNDCGQAAIAGVLDFHDVSLGGMGPGPWPNDTALAQVKADGWDADLPFGVGWWGTTPWRMADALKAYGLQNTGWGRGGAGGYSRDQCWGIVKSWVDAGYPVPVLVQANYLIGGVHAIAGHWPVLVDITPSEIVLMNVERGNDPCRVTHNAFLSMWNYLGGIAPYAFVVGQR